MRKNFLISALAITMVATMLTGCGDNGGGGQDNPEPDTPQVQETFSITYDANGGTGSTIDDNKYLSGTKITVAENEFVAPEGKEFSVWNEEADGSGTNHRANEKYKIYENVTFYAQWVDKQIIDIDPEDKTHRIQVEVPNGVTYTLSKNKAEAGETVTITLVLSSGMTLEGNPTSNEVTFTKTGELVYTFTMPDKDVWISVKAKVSGDAVLTGEIVATLEDEDGDGIYVAKDVVVPTTKSKYSFSYVVKNPESGSATRLSSAELDETRTFADVTSYYSSSDKNYDLTITGGATYDFYYDSNVQKFNSTNSNSSASFSCWIIRKEVNVLPNNSKTLNSLFSGANRSDTTVNPSNLTSISYSKVVDGNDTEVALTNENYTYNFKKISDYESYAIAHNNLTNVDYNVYKHYDETNKVYEVVNNYPRSEGNNESKFKIWSLDPYSDSRDIYFQPYSAKLDVVSNSYHRNEARTQIIERNAKHYIGIGAHYSSDLEMEIYESYRGDFDGTAVINAANAEGSHCDITSTRTNDGFKVNVVSQLEYNHVESGSTADSTQQFASTFVNEMVFRKDGALVSMNYVEKHFDKAKWNFTDHTPKDGVTPVSIRINVTNGYNETFDRETVLNGFNKDDYFVSSFTNIHFYNEKSKLPNDPNKSNVIMNDLLQLYPYMEGPKVNKLVDSIEFEPSTALDMWQYKVTATSDESIIGKNNQRVAMVIGTGDCTVTFTNNTTNSNNVSKTIDIHAVATGSFHSLYVNQTIQGYDSFGQGNANIITGTAGRTGTYYIDSGTNSGAPIDYWLVIKAKDKYGSTVYSTDSKYFTVENYVDMYHDEDLNKDFYHMRGHDLTLNFNTEASLALTSIVSVEVIFASNYYTDGFGPTTNTIRIKPKADSVENTTWQMVWNYEDNPLEIYEVIKISFSSNGVGKIVDSLYDVGTVLKYTNTFNFTYVENTDGTISVRLTSVDIQEPDLPTSASEYVLELPGLSETNQLMGVLYFVDGDGYTYDLFGVTSSDSDGFVTIEYYQLFGKKSK